MKRAYYYFFYKLYKHYEKGPSVWLSDWKASLTIDILFYFIVASIYIYYKVFINRYIRLSENNLDAIILVLIVGGFNYYIFHYKDQWKEIVKEFDTLSNKVDKKGGWIVFLIILFIIGNLIFSFYLMSQIDWSQYR